MNLKLFNSLVFTCFIHSLVPQGPLDHVFVHQFCEKLTFFLFDLILLFVTFQSGKNGKGNKKLMKEKIVSISLLPLEAILI